MVTITGALTFKQYMAANRFGMLHTTFGRKLYFIGIVYALPTLCIIGLPYSAWLHLEAWRSTGGQASLLDDPGSLMFVLWLFFFFYRLVIYPWRMRRRYKQQDIDKPVTVEFSDQDVHVIIPHKADIRFEWAAFASFAEIPEIFLLFIKPRLVPVMAPFTNLTPAQQAELRTLLAAHLKPIA